MINQEFLKVLSMPQLIKGSIKINSIIGSNLILAIMTGSCNSVGIKIIKGVETLGIVLEESINLSLMLGFNQGPRGSRLISMILTLLETMIKTVLILKEEVVR